MADSFDFMQYEEADFPVEGGDLNVLRWEADYSESGQDTETIVFVHGITANALVWAGVAAAVAGRAHLVAPDLRGRAGSRGITGPWGIDKNVDDLIAVLDSIESDRVRLVGHSLGAFVACTAAQRFPDRVSSVLAVDGGLGFQLPPGLDPDAVLEAVVGPAVRKLSMTFADPEAYLDFHRVHPSFVGNWTPELTSYLGRDTIVREDGAVVSSCIEAAIRADGKQVLLDDTVRDAIKHLSCPVTLLYAERGLQNEEQALYDEARLAAAALPPNVTAALVPGTNHYTVIAPGAGVDAIVGHLFPQPV